MEGVQLQLVGQANHKLLHHFLRDKCTDVLSVHMSHAPVILLDTYTGYIKNGAII